LWKRPQFGLLLAALLAASLWFYVQRVLIPYQQADAAAHGRPRGNLSDLYPRWLGTRELLLHHRDPYSPEVTDEIQAGYYGRTLIPNRSGDPKDEERFAYPIYVVFLLAPTAWLPFPIVQIAFSWILEILTVVSVLLWLRVLRWQPSLPALAILVLMTLSSYSAVQGIKLQQLSLVVCALLAASVALLVTGQLVAAGVFLAAATIKPQLVVLLVPWLLFWAINNWRERQRFFWSFAGGCALLAGAGEYILPGWIGRFREALSAYQRYTAGSSPLGALTTPAIGRVLGIVVLLGTATVCWRLRRAPAGSPDFNLALAVVLAATLVVVPMLAPYNQLILVPAVFLIARSWPSLWQKSRQSRAACCAAAVFVFWPWVASLALVVASLFLPPSTVQRAWTVPLWTIPATSIALLGPLVFLFGDSMASRPRAA
jgi:hypothetical protein